jgi:Na+/H+-translocating membrane pyrophosphatase
LPALDTFSEDDVRVTLQRTLRLLAIVTVIGALLVTWKLGWQSALLLVIGAVISGSGLWEWMRLMSAVMARMDISAAVAEGKPAPETTGPAARPMGLVLTGFFLRLALTVAVLYVSLKTLHGSVIALAAGLALGIFALTIEAIRMARTWTN